MRSEQPNNVKIEVIKRKDEGVNKKESQMLRQRMNGEEMGGRRQQLLSGGTRENRVCLDNARKRGRQELETGVAQEKTGILTSLALCCSKPACTWSVAEVVYMVLIQLHLNFS